MHNSILHDTRNRMEKCLSIFQNNINNMRIGRASTGLVDNICIEYYGVKTPLKELANITIENSNTLKIAVFDRNILNVVEKEIFHSKLEVTPLVHDHVIRIIIPSLTEERRKKLCKHLQSDAEHTRISIRNMRRDANDNLKNLVKQKVITIDIERMTQHEIQALTDKYIKQINNFFIKKKTEIMRV
ncbi:ribosome recycling factor [Buchnera aphidicola (Takecallis taiwana)]|uniref:ribosome recycling factor n=1 Tax=Buchnera aphidicola TaxID=9 RepID=UPI0031B6768E